MPDGMTVQGYQGSDAQVVTEEEVNRRRAANERKRAVAPPRPGAPRLPLTPPGGPEEDPRRALCSNAELLDALDSEHDADAALDLYQAATQPTADQHDVLTEHAHSGDGELDVDDILEALERHHRDAQPTRPHTSDARGTADLAPSTLTTRPRRHSRARSRPGRQPLARGKATRAAIGLVAIVGLCAWAALSLTGTPHAATAPARPVACEPAADRRRAHLGGRRERATRSRRPQCRHRSQSSRRAGARSGGRTHAPSPRAGSCAPAQTRPGPPGQPRPRCRHHRPCCSHAERLRAEHHNTSDDERDASAGAERHVGPDQPPRRRERPACVRVRRHPRARSLARLLTESETP